MLDPLGKTFLLRATSVFAQQGIIQGVCEF
jgi:hypothetical protein